MATCKDSKAFAREDLAKLQRLVDDARRVVVTCHRSPDGDALGSSLACAQMLTQMGKEVSVVTPDEPSHVLKMLPGAKRIMPWSSFGEHAERKIAQADLIFCMDFNGYGRLSRIAPFVEGNPCPKVMIDHHKDPEGFATVMFSQPEASSTCQLLYALTLAMNWQQYIDADVATCMLGGMITDTGGYHYNTVYGHFFATVDDLTHRGADNDWLMRCLVDTHSEASMRLESFAIAECMEIFEPDDHAALIMLDRETLNSFGYKKGDTEGLVNKPLAIPGIVYSCYLRQEEDYIKVSMRSVADFPVDQLCKRDFGGGGHLNAAGGEFKGSLEDCAAIFRSRLAENRSLISDAALKYAKR